MLAIRQFEDEFKSSLLLLGDVLECACAIAIMDRISKLLDATYDLIEAVLSYFIVPC